MKTILILDNPETRSELAQALRDQGFRVVECGDGGEALTQLHRVTNPVLIVAEISLPGIDIDTVRSFQLAIPALRAIPMLIVSSHEAMSQRAASLGAVASFSKPIHLPTVVEGILALLQPGKTP